MTQRGINHERKMIEHKIVMETKARGGMALKFVSPSFSGMPDRLILLPGGKMAFVEVKAPGKKPRPLQEVRHAMLRRLGFSVYVLDDPEEIPAMLDSIAHMQDGEEGGNG